MSEDRAPGLEPDETLATSTADPIQNPAGDGIEISDAAAAQGGTRTDMVKVLGASIVLVLLVLFGLYFFHLGPLNANNPSASTRKSHAEQFNTAPQPQPAPTAPPAPQ